MTPARTDCHHWLDSATPAGAPCRRGLLVASALAAMLALSGCESLLKRRALELFTPLREPSLVQWKPRTIDGVPTEYFGSCRTAVLVEGADRVYIFEDNGIMSIAGQFLNGELLERPAGIGSGALITADGYILTAAHCAEHPPITIIAMNSAKSIGTYPVRIVWEGVPRDAQTDFALLKIDGDTFDYFTFADDLDFSAGSPVLAVGLGLQTTRSSGGMILARAEPGLITPDNIATVVEVDNPILPGDSGGPVITSSGALLGVSSVLQFYFDGSERIGFISRPSRAFIQRLIEEDRARRAPSPATMPP